MTTFKISTPVPEFSGQVAGVWFTRGKAETDSEGAVSYFERHGYDVEAIDNDDQVPAEQVPAEPKKSAPAKPAPKG